MNVEQFAYLKCPSKIRAAIINEGGPRLSVDMIEQKLTLSGTRRAYQSVGDPTEADGEVFAPRGFNVPAFKPVPKSKPKLVLTDGERARIAAIAAKIPDRVVDKPRRVMRKKRLVPTAENFTDQLISFVLRRARMNRASFFKKRRQGKPKGAAALVATVLRELDPKKYSYPKIARILRKDDHTTIMWAVERWPFYTEEWPDLADVYADVWEALREGGE